MANSKVFKTTFEKVAKEATCNYCHEIIWNSPIYEVTGEYWNSIIFESTLTLCETCINLYENSSQENFKRNFQLERALIAFETDCKYKSVGCIIRGGPHNIILHQEKCEFRMFSCPISRVCKEKNPIEKLFEHSTMHEHIFDGFSQNEFAFNGSFYITSLMFVCSDVYSKAFICNTNFVVQIRFSEKKNIALIWVRSMESKLEAKHINYKIKILGSENKISFEGPIRNIGEKIDDIVKSQNGLVIPITNIKKYLQEDRLHFSVEIKDLKSTENLTVFESENMSKEPLNKRIKIEKN